MEHVNTQINEIVVMYLSAEKVIRPPAPPDVSVCKGIMSCFSFLFLGVARHYAKRPFSCCCKVCSRVRGRGVGSQSSRSDLLAMFVNSSELRDADFHLAEVRPLQLDAVARGGCRTRGAAVRKLQDVGNNTFVLSVENDNDFRSRCE
jgi:hypothetical protein